MIDEEGVEVREYAVEPGGGGGDSERQHFILPEW
jgi:hypothetical protein